MAISLDSLKRGKEIRPPRVILYGVKGIGKTTWASHAPNPIFLFTEEGLGKLEVTRFPEVAKTWSDVIDSIEALLDQDHSFNTLVIDSLDWLERLVHSEVRRIHGDEIFTDYGKGYVHSIPYFDELFRRLNDLRDRRKMMIILLAHATVSKVSPPDAAEYTRYNLDLHQKSAGSACEEFVDAVLFANYRVYTSETKGDFGKKVTQGVGDGERVVFTEERPAHSAKNRWSLPYELPLDFSSFYGEWKKGMGVEAPAEKKKSKKEIPPPAETPAA